MKTRPKYLVVFEMVVVTIFGMLLLASLTRLALRADWASDGIKIAGSVLAGYIIADFLTGFIHWFCDTFFEEDSPVIGPAIIGPFREHHRDPKAMTHHGFLELTANNCIPLIPLLLIPIVIQKGAVSWLDSLAISISLAAFATNHFHLWAHSDVPPKLVGFLQRSGLILSPQSHALHHEAPHRNGYCVTSGWCNRTADAIGVWRFLERVAAIFGIPKTDESQAKKAA